MTTQTKPSVLVTGSTDGIGRATALALAQAGANVIVHGRNQPRVQAALAELRAAAPNASFEGVSFDLATAAGVRAGAAELLKMAPHLDVLINNAGVFASERVVTADGFELSLAVNYVGPWLLTELLAGALGEDGTVINVASIAHMRGAIDLDNLDLARGFTGYQAYAQSKLAQVMHSITLSERGRRSFSLHPGVIGTKLLREGFGPVRGDTVENGAATSVRLAAATLVGRPGFSSPALEPIDLEEVVSGSYFSDGHVTPAASAARNAELRNALDARIRAQLGLS